MVSCLQRFQHEIYCPKISPSLLRVLKNLLNVLNTAEVFQSTLSVLLLTTTRTGLLLQVCYKFKCTVYNVIGYFKESSYLPECLVLSIQVSIDIVLDTMNGALVFTLPYKKNISSML